MAVHATPQIEPPPAFCKNDCTGSIHCIWRSVGVVDLQAMDRQASEQCSILFIDVNLREQIYHQRCRVGAARAVSSSSAVGFLPFNQGQVRTPNISDHHSSSDLLEQSITPVSGRSWFSVNDIQRL